MQSLHYSHRQSEFAVGAHDTEYATLFCINPNPDGWGVYYSRNFEQNLTQNSQKSKYF
jgi:hypothetical protein